MKNQDVSNRLIVVLAVITILVSILGTWTIINAINTATVYDKPAPITGKVSITIVNEPQKESILEEAAAND